MDKERKKLHRWEQKNRWMPHYELKYGVQPIEYGPGQGIDGAISVMKGKCRFCESFGREVLTPLASDDGRQGRGDNGSDSGKAVGGDFDVATAAAEAALEVPPIKRRKKRQTQKVFGPNFRTDNLESHLSREHPTKWKEYERLRDSEKKTFFPETPEVKDLLGMGAAAAAAVASVGGTQSAAMAAAAAAGLLPMTSATTPTSMLLAQSGMSTYSIGAALNGQVGAGLNSQLAASHKLGLFPSLASLELTSAFKTTVSAAIVDLVDQLLTNRSNKTAGLASADGAVATQPGGVSAISATSTPTAQSANGSSAGGFSGNVTFMHQFVRTAEGIEEAVSLEPEFKLADGNVFSMVLKHEWLMGLLIDYMGTNVDIPVAVDLVNATQRLLGNGTATTVTTADAASIVRHVVAANLASIAVLMSYSWGYSLVLQFVTHHSTGYVDVRLQTPVNDEVYDLHLLALPLDAHKHSTEAVGTMITRLLTALDSRALDKLVGVTVDGDPYHMAKYKSVATWLRQHIVDVTTNAAFYVLHSGAYHLHSMIEDLLDAMQTDCGFVSTLVGLDALCQTHASLGEILGPLPPRMAMAHWVDIYALCERFSMHRETMLKWCHDHDQASRLPPAKWWVLVFLLRDTLKDALATLRKCQDQASSFADVQRHIRDLMLQLRVKFNIKTAGSSSSDPATAASPEASSTSSAGAGMETCVFSYQDFVNAVIPLDLFMYEAFQLKSMEGVDDPERVQVFELFKKTMSLLVSRLVAVAGVVAGANMVGGLPDEDTSVHQYSFAIPPSTPYEMITMNNLAFMELLNHHQFRIRSKWTGGKVLAMITEDRNRMVSAFSQRGALYESVVSGGKPPSTPTTFRDAWKDLLPDFASLGSFAIVFGSLLTVSKNSDDSARFSRQIRDGVPPSNLALEAHLHAQQVLCVNTVRRSVESTIV
ncbi:TPA: hypothetical protein N0F65_002584 [Lagenidium giganteum]|uniref:Uncharacterized protein n=1 Tax=Lagenidium giganteum TaxID=4803 RepID=A0AAV2YZI9_9STRA|nr:TPA: hypothetical protein N0F65_002584 [Lagenidium giganteum]